MRLSPQPIRLNRTGLTVAPGMSEDMLLAARETVPSSEGGAEQIAEVRIRYAKEAEPVGSIPEALAEDGMPLASDEESPNPVLVDKLGERLGFERAGVRLYDALLSKFDAFGSWEGGPERSELVRIRDQENEHFTMLGAAIAALDGDPTAVTPSADLHAVAGRGLRALLTDPRVDLRQSLEAILVAELVDNDAWENLADLSRALGQEPLVQRFEQARDEEREHLRLVRRWLGTALSRAATGAVDPAFEARQRRREQADDLVQHANGNGKPHRGRHDGKMAGGGESSRTSAGRRARGGRSAAARAGTARGRGGSVSRSGSKVGRAAASKAAKGRGKKKPAKATRGGRGAKKR